MTFKEKDMLMCHIKKDLTLNPAAPCPDQHNTGLGTGYFCLSLNSYVRPGEVFQDFLACPRPVSLPSPPSRPGEFFIPNPTLAFKPAWAAVIHALPRSQNYPARPVCQPAHLSATLPTLPVQGLTESVEELRRKMNT